MGICTRVAAHLLNRKYLFSIAVSLNVGFELFGQALPEQSPADVIRSVLADQAMIVRSFGPTDRNRWFAQVYELVTQGELRALATFDHPDVVADEVKAFHAYYKSNLESQQQGRAGDEHWKKAFDAAKNGEPIPFLETTPETGVLAIFSPDANALLSGKHPVNPSGE